MKRVFALIIAAVMLLSFSACGVPAESISPQTEPSKPLATPKTNPTPNIESIPSAEPDAEDKEENDGMTNITITVGDTDFFATLYDNDTTMAFAAMLPMSLNMSELNSNEKFFNLPEHLPTDSERVGSINTGDLMLYGSDCLVLFYESFSTSYSYTRLGVIEDASGLADALGSGSMELTFTLSD